MSITNNKAYRATAKSMLGALRELIALDNQSHDLGQSAGMDLPTVDLGVLKP